MMLRFSLIAGLALLAACGPKPEAAPPPVQTPTEMEAPAHQALTGLFTATSSTAMGVTGDLAVTPERVTLSKGHEIDTATAEAIPTSRLIAAGQPSFAATYVGSPNLNLELRRITATATTAGTTPQPLCGPSTAPTYVAFAYDAPPTAVTMLVFSGDEPPGDTATKSTLCATYTFKG